MKNAKSILVFAIIVLMSSSHWMALRLTDHPVAAKNIVSFESMSFSPSQRHGDPEHGDWPSVDDIRKGLDRVAGITGHVRLYTMSGNMDAVPAMARDRGLKVALGIWVDDHDAERTARETESAIALANQYPDTVDMIFVGNEAILRGDASVGEITERMKRVRQATHGRVLVTTGETWDIWLKYSNLAAAADIIGAHILPYWDGVPARQAVTDGLAHYDTIRRAYPQKPVMIAEFGWPSGLMNRDLAEATRANQAMVVRDFVAAAETRGIPYNIVEAFDQPWKTREGDVGPYWGVMDATGAMKFPLSGQVGQNPLWRLQAALGITIAAMLAWLGLGRRGLALSGPAWSGLGSTSARILSAMATIAGAEFIGSLIAAVLMVPLSRYNTPGLMLAWGAGVPILGLLGLTGFDRIRELADIGLSGPPHRLLDPASIAADDTGPAAWPKVSVHVPMCNENTDMVIATLRGLAALDYPDYEVLAIVNNTPDPVLIEPIAMECAALGKKFRFLNFPKISGYKAGALNAALHHTHPEATIIAVVDADYVVERDWLRHLVPVFGDPKVGLVQAPQEHRDEADGWVKRAMNSEYAGFFDAGMVQRNEDDAIVAHGTMLLLRRAALVSVGGWGERFICEDTELGLRLIEAGWRTEYTARRYGRGILPDTLASFRRQRDRWAYGAMRIVLAHWRHFKPAGHTLSGRQKYHFAIGWLHWASEPIAVFVGFSGLCYAIFMQATGLGVPPARSVTTAILAIAAVNLGHTFLVYRLRVRRGMTATILAAITGVSLQLTIASAVFRGLVTTNLPFHVTRKGGRSRSGWRRFFRDYALEAGLGLSLALVALRMVEANVNHVSEVNLFAAVLFLQSIPFLAATGLAVGELVGPMMAPIRWSTIRHAFMCHLTSVSRPKIAFEVPSE